ncbi:MAG: hypothetical protein BWY76_01155 [bacterium ADurb.Bin429]|nr:MAG: hypothetical protein BWY76_01155 [bacterium ADurb.Bin429]
MPIPGVVVIVVERGAARRHRREAHALNTNLAGAVRVLFERADEIPAIHIGRGTAAEVAAAVASGSVFALLGYREEASHHLRRPAAVRRTDDAPAQIVRAAGDEAGISFTFVDIAEFAHGLAVPGGQARMMTLLISVCHRKAVRGDAPCNVVIHFVLYRRVAHDHPAPVFGADDQHAAGGDPLLLVQVDERARGAQLVGVSRAGGEFQRVVGPVHRFHLRGEGVNIAFDLRVQHHAVLIAAAAHHVALIGEPPTDDKSIAMAVLLTPDMKIEGLAVGVVRGGNEHAADVALIGQLAGAVGLNLRDIGGEVGLLARGVPVNILYFDAGAHAGHGEGEPLGRENAADRFRINPHLAARFLHHLTGAQHRRRAAQHGVVDGRYGMAAPVRQKIRIGVESAIRLSARPPAELKGHRQTYLRRMRHHHAPAAVNDRQHRRHRIGSQRLVLIANDEFLRRARRHHQNPAAVSGDPRRRFVQRLARGRHLADLAEIRQQIGAVHPHRHLGYLREQRQDTATEHQQKNDTHGMPPKSRYALNIRVC